MSDGWYYAAEGKAVGPLSLADLTKILSRIADAENALVWQTGFDEWQRAAAVAELAAFVVNPPKPPAVPPPPPGSLPDPQSGRSTASADTTNDEDRPRQQKRRPGRIDLTKNRTSLFAAIVLSGLVLLVWSYYFAPQLQRPVLQSQPQGPTQAARTPGGIQDVPRRGDRVAIDTPSLKGSIALKGGRLDDIVLSQYRETVALNSPPIKLLSPSGSPHPLYAEFGWVGAAGTAIKPLALPNADTVWRQESSGPLTPDHPVVLIYAGDDGITFRRTISVDDKYLFTITDEVANNGSQPVTLYPYGLISMHGAPETLGYYIQHEGMIGELGDQGLQEITYKRLVSDKKRQFAKISDAWLGFTDKYFAVALLPDPKTTLDAEFSADEVGTVTTYQADYLLPEQVLAPGTSSSVTQRLFAGAKEVHVINAYNTALGLRRFDLLVDWGYFFFFTKPLFLAIDFFYRLVGNFGVALLLLTTAIKLIFVPFANKSYRSMIELGRLQPQIAVLREQFPESADQKIFELYKRENVTAPSGCLPIALQIVLGFALYKVLFTTIEMRHAPFFGWIHDLSAPDPSNLFTLFGLISWDPTTVPVIGHFLHLGALPILLGLSFFQLQRNINPTLLGPSRGKVYAALPFLVLYSATNMTTGALIYFTWFNLLSVVHQLILIQKDQATVERINKYSAGLLPNGINQPIVFLTMLTPSLQNILTVLVFWRRSKTTTSKNVKAAED